MCTTEYFQSCLALVRALTIEGVEYEFLTTTNESLVQRARNTSVATFLKTDHSHLMFIDADIQFEPDDVAKLWNLEADIAVGLYPMKRMDEPLSAWVNGELVKYPQSFKDPFEVDYAGTGFMLIKREVFETFQEKWPGRAHFEGKVDDCFSWFDCRVENVNGLNLYLSEDYAFCRDARELGFKIMAHPEIKLIHWGRHGYGG